MGYEESPPSYVDIQATPASGFRIPLRTTGKGSFPSKDIVGAPVAFDLHGLPLYMGSAILDDICIHPCKIGLHLRPSHVFVPYGGREHFHLGRYDLLPFNEKVMEWVPASEGIIPKGRDPIKGGYEENGALLYHALGEVPGVKVPGKTGEHLCGANLSFGGCEHIVKDYSVLCWR
ncbi:hypothetical protein ONZ45_g1925 [Pleurotus djamor]|nr:hypothetical protein ONZ45_g1925 [Pleurotus djamor]